MPMPYRHEESSRAWNCGRPFEFTVLSLRVGRILVAERGEGHWIYQIARRVQTTPGGAYGVLRQFQVEGWVRSWSAPGMYKTTRVLYAVTDKGFEAISDALRPLQVTESTQKRTTPDVAGVVQVDSLNEEEGPQGVTAG